MGGNVQRPIPVDFAQRAAVMYRRQLIEHYNCGDSILRRWIARSGIEPIAAPRKLIPRVVRSGHEPKRAWVAPVVFREVHDVAAHTLRTAGWIVFRCDDRGRAKDGGGFFRVGNVVCDGDELLARAAKYARAAA